MDEAEVIEAFHCFWDGFPGMARLIDRQHRVVAANPFAEERGFAEGVVCANVGDPSLHRECKLQEMYCDGSAKTDNVLPDRIRGWMPVKGHPDLCVHFALPLP